MRIIAGKFRSKILNSPKSDDIRPTSDRVRQSIFNILSSRLSNDFSGLSVLDLFAGTGAMGIEAISRGADEVVFIDSGVEARGLLRQNIEYFGIAGQAKLLKCDASNLTKLNKFEPFNLIFIDPPYGKGLGEKALKSAMDNGWIAPDATIVLEEKAETEIVIPDGFELCDERKYGSTQVWFLKYIGDA
jgi:16S rRNA (guanine966-N2)-methyltransferase